MAFSRIRVLYVRLANFMDSIEPIVALWPRLQAVERRLCTDPRWAPLPPNDTRRMHSSCSRKPGDPMPR